MFNCCLGKSNDTISEVDSNKIISNYKLPDDIYYYEILISRLIEALNYIVITDNTQYNSLAFEYYFFIYLGCSFLIYNNLEKFIEYFELDNKIIYILELLLSIKSTISIYINLFDFEDAGKFIIKIENKKIFYNAKMFWFIKEEPRYQDFYLKINRNYRKISQSDFLKIQSDMRILITNIHFFILKKYIK